MKNGCTGFVVTAVTAEGVVYSLGSVGIALHLSKEVRIAQTTFDIADAHVFNTRFAAEYYRKKLNRLDVGPKDWKISSVGEAERQAA